MVNDGIVKEAGWKYLLLSVCAYLSLVLEVLLVVAEQVVYGSMPFNEYSIGQSVLHWILTCIIWAFAGWSLVNLARKKLNFDIFAKVGKMKLWQLITVLFGIALSITISYFDWEGFKVIKEFMGKGAVKFIFQYIYYMVETVLFLLIIIFGQRAFDIWTKKTNIPWGGIFCGLTWGISHLISRGYFDISNGVLTTISGFMFGTAYLLTNKDVKKSWLVLFFMFAF